MTEISVAATTEATTFDVCNSSMNYSSTIAFDGRLNASSTTESTTSFNMSCNSSMNYSTTTPFYGLLGFGTLEFYDEFMAGYYINTYYLWVVSFVGIPGNVASVVVISNLKPVSSSSLYIAVLAVADATSLFLKLLYHQLTKYDVRMGDLGCRFLFLCMSTAAMFANWVLVTMTVERFIAVWLPLKVNQYCTKVNAIATMSFCFVFLVALNLQFMWSMVMMEHPPPTGIQCGYGDDLKDFMDHYWYWIDAAFYTIIPCFILFLCNGLIISGMNKSQKIQRAMTGTNSDQLQEKNKQQRQISIMLISVSIVFVILTMPNAIYFAVKAKWVSNIEGGSREHAQNILVEQIIYLLSDINHAINFYMYFCTGRKFRNKFMQLICCRKRSRDKSLYSSRYVTSLSQSNATNVSTLTSVSASKEL